VIIAESKGAQECILKLEQDNNTLREEIRLLRRELQRSTSDLFNNSKNLDTSIDPSMQSLPIIKDLMNDSMLNKSFTDNSRNANKIKASTYTDKLYTTEMSEGVSNPLAGQMDEVTSQIECWTKRLKHLAQEVLILSNARHLRRIEEVISNGRLKSRTTNIASFVRSNLITDGSKIEKNKSPKLKIPKAKKSYPIITKPKHNNLGGCNSYITSISVYF
jgi:hypothetical protein